MLLLLFVIRTVRYNSHFSNKEIRLYLWYAYYIPMTAIPLLSFFGALFVGKSDKEQLPRFTKLLWIVWFALAAGIMTNSLHQWLLIINPNYPDTDYFHGWLYYVVLIWGICFAAISFATLMRKCRLSLSKRLWWVPVVPFVFCLFLFALYFLEGGSPTIAGHRLYNIQEVYTLMFIGCWESFIQIGFVPSNTFYKEIFNSSSINAFITDKNGRIVYKSKNSPRLTEAQMKEAQSGNGIAIDNIRIQSRNIAGGKVFHAENLETINRLNSELINLTQKTDEENILLEEENRIKAEQASLETQNRLYDEIAVNLHSRLQKIDELINTDIKSEKEFRTNLSFAAVLCAYVKRRANLAIIADQTDIISIEELEISIRESMEYLRLAGLSCELYKDSSFDILSKNSVLAYDFFEDTVEEAIDKAHSVLVYLSGKNRLEMKITVDCEIKPQNDCTIIYEDGISYLTLPLKKEAEI